MVDNNSSGIKLSSLTDKQLADLYYDTFGTWYPPLPQTHSPCSSNMAESTATRIFGIRQ
ncbi:hypothetical protein BSTEL_1231 [Bifidobacterium stellenboschense]|uniref:Uncharacterized protein n=1 Tax=Bifidobacterium stellenboschense TaxID=762211 RepID=A0A087DGB1_9BIFI|nr:hypothetical protein BSTEL_1231 [Bifidobacterium stellenboschense]